MSLRHILVYLLGICLFPLIISACNQGKPVPTGSPTVVEATDTPQVTLEASATPIPPSATPVPLALVINGEGITLAEYQAELSQIEASPSVTGTILAPDSTTIVMNEIIDQTLLAQTARENDYVVDQTTLETRVKALEDQLGGAQALTEWQASHGYSEEIFTQVFKRSIEAAWMRDQIINKVPETAEEVHVYQILVSTSAEAEQVYAKLQSGEDFFELAANYDPVTEGDLGWFPRGYLGEPTIDAIVFELQPDQYSEVIHTDIGYHILYLVEKDPAHDLQPDARKALQTQALQDWLKERKDQSEIQILVR